MNLHSACRALALLAAVFGATGATAADPPQALTKFRCYICHSDSEPRAGPAFADVAAAYRGRPNAADAIARKIRDGIRGGGPWHMPPHPEVSADEARAMARYILSLDPKKPTGSGAERR